MARAVQGLNQTRARRWSLWLATTPLVVYATFYLFVVAVRLTLGHWPSYGNPDPGRLPQALVLADVVVTLLLLVVWASPVLAIPLVLALLHPRLRWLLRPIATCSFVWCLIAALT